MEPQLCGEVAKVARPPPAGLLGRLLLQFVGSQLFLESRGLFDWSLFVVSSRRGWGAPDIPRGEPKMYNSR